MWFLSQPLTSALSLSSSILLLRCSCLVVDLDSIEPNGGLLWSSSDASSARKINDQFIFSKPLKIFSCSVSTIHGGASSRRRDEQYHICGVVSFFLSREGHKDGFYQLRETQQKFITFFFHLAPSNKCSAGWTCISAGSFLAAQ